MKKNDFKEIQIAYFQRRDYLKKIKPGDLVWEEINRGGMEVDYHPAIVRHVNVDEDCIEVIDVSDNNKEKTYVSFLKETELLQRGVSAEDIREEHKKYEGLIKKLTKY